MHRHPLVAIMLSAAFAFQLFVAGVGAACAMPVGGDASARAASTAAMAAMGMAGMQGDPVGEQVTPLSGDAHGGRVPCDQSTSAAACQLMTPCAGVFVATTSDTPAASEQPSARIAPFTIAIFTSRSTAPELPPPRA